MKRRRARATASKWYVHNCSPAAAAQFVQLEDDEQEVTVVKKALQERIDLDPAGTLRVFVTDVR